MHHIHHNVRPHSLNHGLKVVRSLQIKCISQPHNLTIFTHLYTLLCTYCTLYYTRIITYWSKFTFTIIELFPEDRDQIIFLLTFGELGAITYFLQC